jgi:hypothetical protein
MKNPKGRMQVYDITMLSVHGSHPFQLLKQVTNFRKTLYECYATGGCPYNLNLLQFVITTQWAQ